MQVYDVWRASDKSFIMRAPWRTIANHWRIHDAAKTRVDVNSGPSTLYGNGKHDDLIIQPVMADWFPE
jgi:hypothetical protein